MILPRIPVLLRVLAPVLALAGLAGAPARSQSPAGGEGVTARPPEREARAVWITTMAGLDWPRTTDTAAQRASLVAIVDRLDRAGFNMLFFQVRGRGDAVHRSALEPWSAVLTGTQGRDPGWDPLAVILAEAHARGMEVHAWFNTYFVKGSPGPPPRTVPPHVISGHPGWVVRHGDQWWLDPGEPEAEEHLLRVAGEIVRRYPVDGLHLDYLRYPGRNFDDDRTYARHGGGLPRDVWRRRNVTRFVERVRSLLREIDPAVKLGAAPIGIYRNPEGVRGLESFSDVFQDTHDWTARGLLDYVAPQLYWPIGGGRAEPDFAAMASRWREDTRGAHLYLGIGSYKEEVRAQTERQIAVARAAGAEGQAFFRYANIEDLLPFPAYAGKVLPPAMPWKDPEPPGPPTGLAMTSTGAAAHLRWSPPAEADEEGGYYAVYRLRGERAHEADEERLLAVLPASARGWTDTSAGVGSSAAETWYIVTRVDRAWNESPPAVVPPLPAAASAAAHTPDGAANASGVVLRSLGGARSAGSGGVLLLPFRLTRPSTVEVTLRAAGGGPEVTVRLGERPAGGQIAALDTGTLPPGRYRCVMRAGGDSLGREISIGR